MTKIKGLKKAIGEYHRYNAGGPYDPHYGLLYYDRSTGEIWTGEYYDFGHSSRTVYDDPDIGCLTTMMAQDWDYAGKPVRMATVKSFIEEGRADLFFAFKRDPLWDVRKEWKKYEVEMRKNNDEEYDDYVGDYVEAETAEGAVDLVKDWLVDHGIITDDIDGMTFRVREHVSPDEEPHEWIYM